jgi:hypothetical protein
MMQGLFEPGILKPKEILILSFDRHTRENSIDSSRYLDKNNVFTIDSSRYLDKNNVFTIHSFCHRVLKQLDRLPEIFLQQQRGPDSPEPLNEEDYDSLVSKFLKLDDYTIAGSNVAPGVPLSAIRLIFCDEVQDFRQDYIEVVKRIRSVNSKVKTVIAGDMHQRIYAFQNRKGKNRLTEVLSDPVQLFTDEGYETVFLTENHRTLNWSIVRFNNGFLRNEFKADANNLYTTKEDDTIWKRRPIITYFTTQDEELAYIERELAKIDTEKYTVAILGRSKIDIEHYLTLARKNVEVSTIHKLKGDGKDYIFYVGFTYDKEQDPEITTLVYTAISRPIRKLFITSAFPMADLDRLFGKGTYELVNLQKKIVKPFLIRKQLRENRNSTWYRLKNSHLDSLELKVSKGSCPFAPYVQKEGTNQVNYSSCRRITLESGFEYSLEKQHRWGTYFFRFEDLNLLCRNNYTDIEKIQFCINQVLEFFDYRISLSEIRIHRMDLCYYMLFDNTRELQTYFRHELCPVLFTFKHRTIGDDKRNIYCSYMDLINKGFSIMHRTMYVNHHKKKYNGMTTAIYRPVIKDNVNKINIDSLLKVEIRGRGRISGPGFLPCRLDESVEDLLDRCKGSLLPLFEEWSEACLGKGDLFRKKGK